MKRLRYHMEADRIVAMYCGEVAQIEGTNIANRAGPVLAAMRE